MPLHAAHCAESSHFVEVEPRACRPRDSCAADVHKTRCDGLLRSCVDSLYAGDRQRELAGPEAGV